MTTSLSTVAQISITRATKVPARASFGTLGLMCYHTLNANLVNLVASADEVLDLGATVHHPAYLAALAYFSQEPAPEQMAIIKRQTFTQILELTPVNLTVGFKYEFTVVDPAGVETAISHTVATGTVDAIVDALTALIDPLTDMTAAGDAGTATKLVITATAGKIVRLKNLPNPADMLVYDATAAGTAAADVATFLASLQAGDAYAIAWDRVGEAEAAAAAPALQAADKLHLIDTSDSEAVNSGDTDDIGSTLGALNYSNSSVFYLSNATGSYQSVAEAGKFLPLDPGTENWAHKTLTGIAADELLTGQQSALKAKAVNYYVTIGGLGWLLWGHVCDGDYLDIIRGIHWLKARMAERVVTAFYQAQKIPYTDVGIAQLEALVRAQLEQAKTPTQPGGGALLESYTITVPKAADVELASKANRELPGIEWSAVVQGAVNKVIIRGRVGL
jgi:hypothetical protein